MTDTAGMTAADPIAHETLRKADLSAIGALLESQRIRTVDMATQGRNLWVANGNLVVQGVEPQVDMTPDGVTTTDVNGVYAFGDIGIESMAARLNLPSSHLKTWRADRPDLFDTVVGYFLRGELNGEPSPHITPDGRIHTLRLLTADNTAVNEVDGMVRAMLGGNYFAVDNLDLLSAVADGMYEAGITPQNSRIEADLTESRMVVKVWVPELFALAPAVFGNYRSPFTGETVTTMPKVFAGLVFSNSEVGRGAWSVTPRIVFEACRNGQPIAKDAFEKRHTGERLEEHGVIKWSEDTQRANLALITKKTRDAVRTYLDVDYVKATLASLAADADVRVTEAPEEIITKVTRHTGNTANRSAVLNMFMQGGQYTSGGVMQAYTAAAQVTDSGDVAYDLESRAMTAMQWVAARSR